MDGSVLYVGPDSSSGDSEYETGQYSAAAIKDKAAHAISQIKAQSWPEAMQATINAQVKLMEEALKDLDQPMRKDNMQTQFTTAFATIMDAIEQGITDLHPHAIDKPSLEEFVVCQHRDHYHEVLDYARSVSKLCVARKDPDITIAHMVHIAHASPSPDRCELALRSIALQMSYHLVYENADLSTQWGWGEGYNKTLTSRERCTIERMCAEYQKAVQSPKGRKAMMSSATTLVEQTAKNQAWIRNRVAYLQGTCPRPGDYSLGAMFEYLAFLIDKFCRPSRENKAMIFSKAMRETQAYTAQWGGPENSLVVEQSSRGRR